MIGRMIVDKQDRTTEMNSKVISNKNEISKPLNISSTKLAINERYRRLIPYMTFYYANDLVPPPVNAHVQNSNNVEVEKAIIHQAETNRPSEREPKLIYKTQRHKNIPRYTGNRLTQFNIASSNPTKIFYKEIPVLYHNNLKSSSNYKTPPLEDGRFANRDVPFDRYVPKQIKAPSAPFTVSNKKPFLNIYQNEDFSPNVQYYSSDQGETPKYRLVPYEQTPPVKVVNADTAKNHYSSPELISKESVYIRPRPSIRPHPFYETHNNQEVPTRKPIIVSEIYYERRPTPALVEPVVESGFKPILNSHTEATEGPIYSSTGHEVNVPYQSNYIEKQKVPEVESISTSPEDISYRPEYIINIPEHKQHQESSNSVTLAELLNSLQINKSIPKPITRENVGDSIRTLLNVLNTLKAAPLQNDVGVAVLSTPKPFQPSEIPVVTPHNSVSSTPKAQDPDLQEEPYLAPIHTPSQYLDDYPSGSGSTQRFPLPVTSDEEGGTPGRPGIDYPILTVIPPTKFDCKTQRYKGFFADPETRCQVWHYCDLNGGQASFLCPNGTIFSQAGLTCDWWFNVRCASTTQLYVLNESLYKYILPHSPKFPEDYSGPLVDKYLSLKFKEMEEQFKKNKKKLASDKTDSDDETQSDEKNASTEYSPVSDKKDESTVNRADVIIETPGSSGNVQRLQDE
ncbi:unnamed protein product, partial [Brenthis ino]